MKRRIFIGLAAGGMMLVAAIACKKNFNNQGFDARGTFAGPFIDTMTLPQVISSNTTLAATTLWVLNGKSYVDSGVTLTVSAGARIEAKKFNNNDSASALIVTRGGKLFAEGSQTNPIVFTSNQPSPASGDWGGIVLLGKAPLNRADTTIEGIQLPTVPAGIDVNYGGGGQGLGDTSDCSGRLSYVRIEYAGAVISPDNELNSLTCGGVGAGTVLDHIEAYYGNDDAFEFFGGTVNAKFLFAYVPDDDAFDFDFGYRGKIQFAVSVLNTTESYSANPNGIESDNNGTGANLTPYTQAVLSNLTVIGLNNSADATSKLLFNGAYYRRRSSYILRNSIVMGFPVGVRLDSDIPTQADEANFKKNIVHAFSIPDTMASPSSSWNLNATNKRLVTSVANDSIKLHAPFASTPDFRPDSGSPALTWGTDFSGLPTTPVVGCTIASWTFTTTSYVGAFPIFSASPATNWLNGWTRY